MTETVCNPAQAGPPPEGFAHNPAQTFTIGVSKLSPHAEKRDRKNIREWAADEYAPELVPGVEMVSPYWITMDLSLVVPNGQAWLKSYHIAKCITLQCIVRFFVHVPEELWKAV